MREGDGEAELSRGTADDRTSPPAAAPPIDVCCHVSTVNHRLVGSPVTTQHHRLRDTRGLGTR